MLGRVLSRASAVPSDLAQTTPTLGVVLSTLAAAFAARVRDGLRNVSRQPRKIRVGIDIRPFYEPLTGIGWYLHFILRELARCDDMELYLFGDARLTDRGPHLHASLPENARLCAFDLRAMPLSRFSRPLTAAAYVVWMRLIGCDVFFGANYFLPRLHAAAANRRVITVHDLTYKRHPELLQQETLDNLEREMQREITSADAVICVSESTRRDLLHFYDIDPSRAIAIPSGIEPLRADPSAAIPLPDRYLLFVGTIEPRKNLPVLLDAFEQLKEGGAYAGSLVIVGQVGWKSADLVRRMERSRWRDDIIRLDYLDGGVLADVYNRAEMFIFPSIYEGFGFPLLEAMAHGVPSIAARSSSLPDVGGDACLYFDPFDAAALREAIVRMGSDPALRATLVERGRQRAAMFRWDEAGGRTAAVLRRVAESA